MIASYLRHTIQSFMGRKFRRDILLALEESWSDDRFVGLRGYVFAWKGEIDHVEFVTPEHAMGKPIWHPRPDVAAHYAAPQAAQSGFWIQIPRAARHQIHVIVHLKDGTQRSAWCEVVGSDRPQVGPHADGSGLYDQFKDRINETGGDVLELGSRVVSPGSSSRRPHFGPNVRYTGFDYYPDSNTDVVGDAHQLAAYFPNRRFNAIFSVSVFEHLAMPWLVALEINKALEIGGLTYHSTHFAWPLHERPWDFFRFSDEALKALFPPALGFEIVAAGLWEPVSLHLREQTPEQAAFPAQDAFGGSAVLARKVKDADPDRFRWSAATDEVVTPGTHYPKPGGP